MRTFQKFAAALRAAKLFSSPQRFARHSMASTLQICFLCLWIWLALYTGWPTWLQSTPMKASIPYRMVQICTLRSCSIVRVSFALARAAFDFFLTKYVLDILQSTTLLAICAAAYTWHNDVWVSCLCFTSKESSKGYNGTGFLLDDLLLFWIRGSCSVDSLLLDLEILLYSPLPPSVPLMVVLCCPRRLLVFSCSFPGSVRNREPAAE